MKSDTPIVLAAAKYTTRDCAVADYHAMKDAHRGGEFDHTAISVLTKDENGDLQVERHDTTAKHLAWVWKLPARRRAAGRGGCRRRK